MMRRTVLVAHRLGGMRLVRLLCRPGTIIVRPLEEIEPTEPDANGQRWKQYRVAP